MVWRLTLPQIRSVSNCPSIIIKVYSTLYVCVCSSVVLILAEQLLFAVGICCVHIYFHFWFNAIGLILPLNYNDVHVLVYNSQLVCSFLKL